MRKYNIFAILLLIPLSFFTVKALGIEKENQIEVVTATAADKAELEKRESLQETIQTPAEVVSQSSIATSSSVIGDDSCASQLTAKIALAKFLESDKTSFEYNSSHLWPVASITKLMTAVIAGENGGNDRTVALTKDMVAALGDAGNLQEGEVFKIDDLIKAMLIVSSNDAAQALERDLGGPLFVALMNAKAKELGMNDTRFFDASGILASNQSSPNDLARLTLYIYQKHPDIFKTSRLVKADIVELNSRKKKRLVNINQLAGQANFIGGKTGTNDESLENLLSVFNVDGKPAIVVVLGSTDRYTDTKKLLQCVQ